MRPYLTFLLLTMRNNRADRLDVVSMEMTEYIDWMFCYGK